MDKSHLACSNSQADEGKRFLLLHMLLKNKALNSQTGFRSRFSKRRKDTSGVDFVQSFTLLRRPTAAR
jgi:hypothetical protein